MREVRPRELAARGCGPRERAHAAVGDAVLPGERGHQLPHRLRLLRTEIRATAIQLLVVGDELGPVFGEVLEEVLARAGPQEEEVRPDAGRARLAWRLDDLAELFGPVGDTGED